MSETDPAIQLSWQLVSQFVSWDFCRYMSEKTEESSDRDVLTFLKDMILERTEKSAVQITKHEILAKFLMEARTLKTAARMPVMIALSETLKSLCPELDIPVTKLIISLESLLSNLDQSVEHQNEELVKLIKGRITNAVNDFNADAYKYLPLPDLFQVMQACLSSATQDELKQTQRVGNPDLYQRAVRCLQEEIITPAEAKIIAKALYEDKSLEKIFLHFYETGMEVDSQKLSQSSQDMVSVSQANSNQSSQLSSYYKLIDRLQQTIRSCSQENAPSEDSVSLSLSPRKLPSRTLNEINSNAMKSPRQTMRTHFREQVHSDDSLSLDSSHHETLPPARTRVGFPSHSESRRSKHLELSDIIVDQIQDMEPLNPIEAFLFEPLQTEPFSGTEGHRFDLASPTPSISSDKSSPLRIVATKKKSTQARSLNLQRKRQVSISSGDASSNEDVHISDKHLQKKLLHQRKNRIVSDDEISEVSETIPVVSQRIGTVKKMRKRSVRDRNGDLVEFEESSSDIEDSTSVVPIWTKRILDRNHDAEVHVVRTKKGQVVSDSLNWNRSYHEQNGDSDNSDCDKNPQMPRFLTPTVFRMSESPEQTRKKTKSAPRISDIESLNNSSSQEVIDIDSQKNDPNWSGTSAIHSQTDSLTQPSTSTKKNHKRKRSKESQKKKTRPPAPKRQTTLQDFMPPVNPKSKKPTTVHNPAKKKVFKLFDNDRMATLNETALFQEPVTSKRSKQTFAERVQSLGNKRKCRECKKTFRTPTDLKKHVFMEHTSEDIHTPTDDFSSINE